MDDMSGAWMIIQADGTGYEAVIARLWDAGDATAMRRMLEQSRPWNTYRVEIAPDELTNRVEELRVEGRGLRDAVASRTGVDPLVSPVFAWSDRMRCTRCLIATSTVAVDGERLCFNCYSGQ